MSHKEKLQIRRKELLEAMAPLQNELAEIDELLGIPSAEQKLISALAEKKRIQKMRDSASHRDYCDSENCLGQCMVR